MSDLPAVLTFPARTLRERGGVGGLLSEAAAFGPRGVIVHGACLDRGDLLGRVLGGRSGDPDLLLWRHAGGEPTLDQVEALRGAARRHAPDWIAAVGGGSVLDLAKTAAGLLDAPRSMAEYHQGAAPLPPSRVPFLAAPTTAGAGSEATAVCVLTDTRTGLKQSIRHPSYMARVVILDAVLLATCPPAVIAASGLDAFAQAVESYLSRHATWFTDALALKAASLVRHSLERVFLGDFGAPADDLMLGSYLAGVALSNARLGLVHGLAHPLGARYRQPHGLVCGVCLPHVLAFNRQAAAAKLPALGQAVGGDAQEVAADLLARLGVRSPFAGQALDDRDGIVRETLASGSTAANPRAVAQADVSAILDALFAP